MMRVRTLRALVGASAVLAACSIPDVDLEGRPCPCIDGYVCEASTSTCVRAEDADGGRDASSPFDGGPDGGARLDGGGDVDGALPTDAGRDGGGGLDGGGCFFDDFEDDMLDGWRIQAGPWVAMGGEALQTDANASLAYMFASATETFADYRIRSRMRATRDPNMGALEIDFRIDPDNPGEQYFCNWEPTNRRLLVMWQTADIRAFVLDDVFVDTTGVEGYTPLTPVTMNLEVRGASIRCWLDEIPGAELTVTDSRYARGAVGFKTYAIAAAYEDIEVCPL